MESSYTTKAQLRSSLQRVADKIESAEDKIDVLSGVANGITARIEGVEDDISSLQTQVDGISVPTKTSDLTNDSGYIKSVNGKSANAAGAVSLVPPDIGAASNPNLLDNWHFPDPINQRGATEYTGSRYTIDRWRMFGGANHKASLVDGGISLQASGQQLFFQQKMENSKMYYGKTLVFSVLMADGTFYSAKGTVPTTNPANDMSVCYSLFSKGLIAVYMQATGMIVPQITVDSGHIVEVKDAKLEFSDVQTLVHKDASGNWVLNDPPPNKAQELLKCQRYMCVLNSIGGLSISTVVSDSNGAAYFPIYLPVNMRVTPTHITTGNLRVHGQGKSYESASFFEMPLNQHDFNIVTLRVNGLEPFTTYSLDFYPDGSICLDANL